MLFCLRAMKPELKWKERPIWFAFWAINIGLMLEIVLSLLPVGLMQTYQSVSVGYWSARSSEFMQTELMQTLRWLRMIDDTIFALGGPTTNFPHQLDNRTFGFIVGSSLPVFARPEPKEKERVIPLHNRL